MKFPQVSKEEVLEIAEKNGFNKKEAEALLVVLGKRTGGVMIDLIGLVARKTENKYDDMIVAAGEPKMRELLDGLEVKL